MILLYILLIVLAAFPLLLTAQRMRRALAIKKNGVQSNAVVTQIKTFRTGKGGAIDILILEYKDRVTGQPFNAKATVSHQKYKIGDNLPIAYLPDKPSKYAIDVKNAYLAILIFSIVLFLFVLFAVYKINEMVKSGSMQNFTKPASLFHFSTLFSPLVFVSLYLQAVELNIPQTGCC